LGKQRNTGAQLKSQATVTVKREDIKSQEIIQLSQDEVRGLWEGMDHQLTIKQKALQPKLRNFLEKRIISSIHFL
jgi:hypothetical protein